MHLLRLKKVCYKTGLSRSSLYVAMKRGEFPKSVSIGKRSVAWKSTDIDEWIESRPVVQS
jgi:prophage regulatory protein